MSTATSTERTTLANRVNDIRPPLLDRLQAGYANISHLDERGLGWLSSAIEYAANNRVTQVEDLIDESGLSHPVAMDIHLAATITLGALIDLPLDVEDFLEVASTWFPLPEQRSGAQIVARLIVERRGELNTVRKSSRLANAVLPAFSGFFATVDIRLSFDGNVPELAIPVAVASINTDIESKSIEFQMTLEDVRSLLTSLEELEAQLETAETIAAKVV